LKGEAAWMRNTLRLGRKNSINYVDGEKTKGGRARKERKALSISATVSERGSLSENLKTQQKNLILRRACRSEKKKAPKTGKKKNPPLEMLALCGQ